MLKCMIANIINLLVLDDYFGVSNKIDRAKGIYELPKSFGGAKKQIKRIVKSKR